MKSRELNTIHDLIVTDYKIEAIDDGLKFLHSFKPKTTDTVYKFTANGTPELEEGERYNIGYYIDEAGDKIVDISCVAKSGEVNPMISYTFAKHLSETKHKVNKEKNDARVLHDRKDGYYWGKKYAWREFGLVIPKGAFFAYLDEINHPKIECVTQNPDMPFQNEPSTAYLEDGLEDAITNLLVSAKKATKVRFTSPLYSKQFTIRNIDAITDKK